MTTPPFEILKDSILSRPRMMGTAGEAETTTFLLDFLTRHGLKPYPEEIEWSTAMVAGRKVMLILAALAVILFNLSLWLRPPSYGTFALLLADAILVGIALFARKLNDPKFRLFGRSQIGKNVICEIEPVEKNEAAPMVYFTAHSDSIASNMPRLGLPLIGAALAGLLLSAGLTLSARMLILQASSAPRAALVETLNTLNLWISVLTLACIGVALFAKRLNTSPGACDNGSGSAILLSLAQYYGAHPPQTVRMKFIWCTAEEWGLYGSRGYVAAHKAELAAGRERSYVINVDMVGSELAYLNKAGFIFKKPLNKKLNALIAAAAQEAGIVARAFNAPLGGSSDHAPFQKEKLEVCCFLAQKDLKIIHSEKDTLERVDPQKLEDAVEVIRRVVEKIAV
jgi:hypothetical protein